MVRIKKTYINTQFQRQNKNNQMALWLIFDLKISLKHTEIIENTSCRRQYLIACAICLSFFANFFLRSQKVEWNYVKSEGKKIQWNFWANCRQYSGWICIWALCQQDINQWKYIVNYVHLAIFTFWIHYYYFNLKLDKDGHARNLRVCQEEIEAS